MKECLSLGVEGGGLSAGRWQVIWLQHDAVADLVGQNTVKGLIHLIQGHELHHGLDPVQRRKLEHLRGEAAAPDDGAHDTVPPPTQVLL